jgi:hypothetical protein
MPLPAKNLGTLEILLHESWKYTDVT